MDHMVVILYKAGAGGSALTEAVRAASSSSGDMASSGARRPGRSINIAASCAQLLSGCGPLCGILARQMSQLIVMGS